MNKYINFIYFAITILFLFHVIDYYLSKKNIDNINLNRKNTDKFVSEKILNLPILNNDTNNVINFNSSFSDEMKDDKPRSFWDLLKEK